MAQARVERQELLEIHFAEAEVVAESLGHHLMKDLELILEALQRDFLQPEAAPVHGPGEAFVPEAGAQVLHVQVPAPPVHQGAEAETLEQLRMAGRVARLAIARL